MLSLLQIQFVSASRERSETEHPMSNKESPTEQGKRIEGDEWRAARATIPGSHLDIGFGYWLLDIDSVRAGVRGLTVQRTQRFAGPEVITAEAVPQRRPENLVGRDVVHVNRDVQHGVGRQEVCADEAEGIGVMVGADA